MTTKTSTLNWTAYNNITLLVCEATDNQAVVGIVRVSGGYYEADVLTMGELALTATDSDLDTLMALVEQVMADLM